MFAPLNKWQLVGVILASALLWMQYVNLKDHRQPEPRWRLMLAFGLGVVAWGLAVLGFVLLDASGLPDIQFGERRWTAVYCFLFVGPIEEGAKGLVAYAIVFRWRVFDEPVDGFVYAAAISLGFASVENLYNMPEADWAEQLARTAALPITHTLFSAIWGVRRRLRTVSPTARLRSVDLADWDAGNGHGCTRLARLCNLRLSSDLRDQRAGAGDLVIRHLAGQGLLESPHHQRAGGLNRQWKLVGQLGRGA